MEGIGDILSKKVSKKAPAYQWQDLALRVIKDLNAPAFKRSSVFKVCRDYPETRIMQALNDTKELCTGPNKWAYFFKIIEEKGEKSQTP